MALRGWGRSSFVNLCMSEREIILWRFYWLAFFALSIVSNFNLIWDLICEVSRVAFLVILFFLQVSIVVISCTI